MLTNHVGGFFDVEGIFDPLSRFVLYNTMAISCPIAFTFIKDLDAVHSSQITSDITQRSMEHPAAICYNLFVENGFLFEGEKVECGRS